MQARRKSSRVHSRLCGQGRVSLRYRDEHSQDLTHLALRVDVLGRLHGCRARSPRRARRGGLRSAATASGLTGAARGTCWSDSRDVHGALAVSSRGECAVESQGETASRSRGLVSRQHPRQQQCARQTCSSCARRLSSPPRPPCARNHAASAHLVASRRRRPVRRDPAPRRVCRRRRQATAARGQGHGRFMHRQPRQCAPSPSSSSSSNPESLIS